MNVPILVKTIHEDAIVPQYQEKGDAGFDFHVVEDIKIKPRETKVAKTGLKVAIPRGFSMDVRPRSGLSLKTALRVANAPGTIDSGYRGEVGIICWNTGDELIALSKGSRIAQGIINIAPRADFVVTDELPESDRGEGGFGHSGLN